jgi:hypothetical protein
MSGEPVWIVKCAERVRENNVDGMRTLKSHTLRNDKTSVWMPRVRVEKGRGGASCAWAAPCVFSSSPSRLRSLAALMSSGRGVFRYEM